MFSCVIPVYLTVFKRQTMHGHRDSLLGLFVLNISINCSLPPGRDPVSSQRNSQFNGQFVSHTDVIELEVNSPVFFYTHRLDTQTSSLAFWLFHDLICFPLLSSSHPALKRHCAASVCSGLVCSIVTRFTLCSL